jgi:hypothetical protein
MDADAAFMLFAMASALLPIGLLAARKAQA